MKWLIQIGVGSMVLLLLLFVLQKMGRMRDHGEREIYNNARQVGMALFEFETEYGHFPESSTVAEVKRKGGSLLTLGGHSSNDLFAQLFAAGIAQSESMFYAKSKASKKPDAIWNSDATVLAHGECGFAYIYGLASTGDPDTPLIFGPVIPGTTTLDRKSNDGKAAVLRMDNSVTRLPIDSSGKIIYKGMDLLDPRQPFWHGKAPDVRWPK
ncbi:MAG: hypothetical protein ABIS50_07280 [Luteolibacter sp.]